MALVASVTTAVALALQSGQTVSVLLGGTMRRTSELARDGGLPFCLRKQHFYSLLLQCMPQPLLVSGLAFTCFAYRRVSCREALRLSKPQSIARNAQQEFVWIYAHVQIYWLI